MTTYSFTLILASVDVLTPDMGDALERAGCDDANMGNRCGVVSLTFDREAESLGKAIGPAIEDVERAGSKVARFEIEKPATVE
jgi:hypothetical protein